MRVKYQYNSYSQLTASQSPDGGLTRYFYNPKGQLVLSQNQEQLPDISSGYAPYSYTVYDRLGRVVEVGKLYGRVMGSGNLYYHLLSHEDQQLLAAQPGFPVQNVTAGTISWEVSDRSEVTRTQYSVPLSAGVSNYFGQNQQNLRGRIATVIYQEEYDADSTLYDYALHFSYDIHGNVTTLITEDIHLKPFNAHLKTLDYEYNLISGNVKKVSYQHGRKDSRYHTYTYDEDNRLKTVMTSGNDLIYEQDARYDYYDHGPLARTEIGELSIQGLDYVYNIQGWLKSMNSNTLNPERDPGKDGDYSADFLSSEPDIHAKFARDVFGFSLGYFENDYKAIDPAKDNFIADESALNSDIYDLYNGNISHSVTALTDQSHTPLDIHFNRYRYDQLNRLKSHTVFTAAGVIAGNNWTGAGTNGDYLTQISYDFNGNITTLKRNGYAAAGHDMDDLRYFYSPGGNRLLHVRDDVPAANGYDNDYKGSSPGNFEYDSIGRLTQDIAEEIAEIKWNVYGKVKSIIRTSSSNRPDLEFRYDPFGNRIAKIEKPRDGSGLLPAEHWIYTHYARDASGTSMAVYTTTHPDVAAKEFVHSLKEQYLYGSKRLGGVKKATHEDEVTYTGTFTALKGIDVDSIKKQIEGNAALLRFSGDQVTSGLRFTLLDDNGTVVSATTGAGTLSDEFHAFGGAVHGTPDYDTLHVLNDPDAFIVQSTNHSSTKTTNLYLRYEAYNNLHIELLTAHEDGEKNFANHNYGLTQYELTNYLGNVQTTVSNRYLFGDSTEVKLADIYTYADYYAFGFEKPLRNYNSADYSRGFQGMYKDDEVSGTGNSYHTYFRQYDSRLGRWKSVDPVVHPWMSSYAAFNLNPILYADPRGDMGKPKNNFFRKAGQFVFGSRGGGGEKGIIGKIVGKISGTGKYRKVGKGSKTHSRLITINSDRNQNGGVFNGQRDPNTWRNTAANASILRRQIMNTTLQSIQAAQSFFNRYQNNYDLSAVIRRVTTVQNDDELSGGGSRTRYDLNVGGSNTTLIADYGTSGVRQSFLLNIALGFNTPISMMVDPAVLNPNALYLDGCAAAQVQARVTARQQSGMRHFTFSAVSPSVALSVK